VSNTTSASRSPLGTLQQESTGNLRQHEALPGQGSHRERQRNRGNPGTEKLSEYNQLDWRRKPSTAEWNAQHRSCSRKTTNDEFGLEIIGFYQNDGKRYQQGNTQHGISWANVIANRISREMLSTSTSESVKDGTSKMPGSSLTIVMNEVQKHARDFVPFEKMPASPMNNGTLDKQCYDNIIVPWTTLPTTPFPNFQQEISPANGQTTGRNMTFQPKTIMGPNKRDYRLTSLNGQALQSLKEQNCATVLQATGFSTDMPIDPCLISNQHSFIDAQEPESSPHSTGEQAQNSETVVQRNIRTAREKQSRIKVGSTMAATVSGPNKRKRKAPSSPATSKNKETPIIEALDNREALPSVNSGRRRFKTRKAFSER
ncbi:hypothetical protein RUND412_009773, partial [Rhizina undulata]